MSWSGWYLRNSSISAILRSVIGVVTPFRLLVVLLLEGNAPVTFSVNHRPDSTGFYTLPGTLTAHLFREWPGCRTLHRPGDGGRRVLGPSDRMGCTSDTRCRRPAVLRQPVLRPTGPSPRRRPRSSCSCAGSPPRGSPRTGADPPGT